MPRSNKGIGYNYDWELGDYFIYLNREHIGYFSPTGRGNLDLSLMTPDMLDGISAEVLQSLAVIQATLLHTKGRIS